MNTRLLLIAAGVEPHSQTEPLAAPSTILKLRVTFGAALKLLEPDCDAVIVQVPNATFETNIPDTVHTLVVEDENDTTNFEEAAADSPMPVPVKSEVFLVPGLGNSIVWSPAKTVNEIDTGAAAKTVAVPAWLASIVQVPVVIKVTVLPVTEHTLDVCEA